MGNKFMLVDDNLIDIMVHKRLLQNAYPDCNIMAYNGAIEGLNYLTTYRNQPQELPDILLLDIIMPRLDGFEFLEELHKIFPEIPFKIFLLSATIHDADFAKAAECSSVITILGKPLDTSVLNEWLA